MCLVCGCPFPNMTEQPWAAHTGMFLCHSTWFGVGEGVWWNEVDLLHALISEYAALQPVPLLPPGWSLFTCQRGPSLSSRKVCLQAGSRGAGALVSARAGLCPACAEIDPVLALPPLSGLAAEQFTSTTEGITFGRAVMRTGKGGRPSVGSGVT